MPDFGEVFSLKPVTHTKVTPLMTYTSASSGSTSNSSISVANNQYFYCDAVSNGYFGNATINLQQNGSTIWSFYSGAFAGGYANSFLFKNTTGSNATINLNLVTSATGSCYATVVSGTYMYPIQPQTSSAFVGSPILAMPMPCYITDITYCMPNTNGSGTCNFNSGTGDSFLTSDSSPKTVSNINQYFSGISFNAYKSSSYATYNFGWVAFDFNGKVLQA